MASDAVVVGDAVVRLHAAITGAVQGVGFRPFVYRLARELDLRGWVLNDGGGVELEVEGAGPQVECFAARVQEEAPARAVIAGVTMRRGTPRGYDDFRIVHSRREGAPTLSMLPDMATCGACRAEIFDAADRRARYPFTNCTDCGPRFSIIRALPYDRAHTSMSGFRMCPVCQAEYDDAGDRRFHAQPNACPDCGPAVSLWAPDGGTLATGATALDGAAAAVRDGRILALKGLGGFHLIVDAASEEAVARLRERKGRYEKPLALMVPDLDAARRLCRVDAAAADALTSHVAPIVLLPRLPDAGVAAGVAPDNPYLGVMLPYTPLHHLLMWALQLPVVATSGNRGGEPICTDEHEALLRLGGIADAFLAHDRPIVRHVDDSVVAFHGPRMVPLRRARGLAPLPVRLPGQGPVTLAVGAHLKNVVALALGDQAFLSQHLGDMDTPRGLDAFRAVIADFLALYDARPAVIAHDLHPGYPTTRWALDAVAPEGADAAGGTTRAGGAGGASGADDRLAHARCIGVHHHHAHLAACLADAGCDQPALGVTWDGTGDGGDGSVWGGEFLLGDARSV
ncbi:MAG TPA: carbamoyltransferase HypF, partial [Longimicrobiales bacterium]|nr:carbamoyltransferase HypF [Longimicrobiales bacterium]